MAVRDIVQAAAGNVGASLYVEDVFSTYLYTGNGSSQTINNGIGLGTAYGGSIFFDGNGDYISAPSNSAFDFGTGNFTVEFWLNYSSTVSYQTVFDINYGTAPNLTLQSNSGVMGLYVNGTSITITSSVTDTAGVWNHYAIVRNGSTITMYRNGTSVGTTTYSGNVGNSSVPVYIGGSPNGGGYYTNGYISNCRIVKGTAVYTTNFTPPTSPLLAISGTSLLTCQAPNATTDYSSNALPITVTNAVAQNGGGPFTDAEAGYGGLVWIKDRSSGTYWHCLYDTIRGATKQIYTNRTDGQDTEATSLTSFNTNGFSLGSYVATNTNNNNYASWTFRKAEKFFDVVTYTGNGTAGRTVAHNLGSVPGTIIVKRTDTAEDWAVYHTSLGNTKAIFLNYTSASDTNVLYWNNTSPTSTQFSVGSWAGVNASGGTYVAYLFAHDAGGFGDAGDQSVIKCGSVTATGGNVEVNLGWEPQWVLVKNASVSENWRLLDNMRGITNAGTKWLFPNTSGAETDNSGWNELTATGFKLLGWGSSGNNYIYIAIRRGPMKTPTSGTSVFAPVVGSSLNSSFVTDFAFIDYKPGGSGTYPFSCARLTGNTYLKTSATSAELTFASILYGAVQNGIGNAYFDSNFVGWLFQRAPSFMDVVCYTGTGSARTVSHNLGVAPELIIVKARSATGFGNWPVYTAPTTETKYLLLNLNSNEASSSTIWNDTAPTSSVFSVGTSTAVNGSGGTYVAYLFASLNGVSKVGTYTGNGSSQTINCGFTAGARFVLVKSTSTGDWVVFDSARGIVSGNDPYLLLNSTAAEVTDKDAIDTDNTGFIVNQTTGPEINGNGEVYIYLAIA